MNKIMTEIIELLVPVSEEIQSYRPHDPNERRLIQSFSFEAEEFPDADAVILGCPQDEGVRRNNGRPGAGKAPREIRKWLYRYSTNKFIQKLKIVDVGDVKIGKTLEETHERLRSVIKELTRSVPLVIVLGGGNDISYPDCAGLCDNIMKDDVLVFNIDKHFDVRDLDPRNSGTPYRLLLEENIIKTTNLFELGSESLANSPIYREYLDQKGVIVHELEEMRKKGIQEIFQEIFQSRSFTAIFWGFDLDAVRASDAPGVSASYPTGFTAEEVVEMARIAGKTIESRIVEFTETNPEFDVDGRTCKLVATMIYHVLSERGKAFSGEN